MSELVFVDTNVLVYRRDASERDKQERAQLWINLLWTTRAGRLSSQVLQEYYHTVTRKLKPGIAPAEAREQVRDLAAWKPVIGSLDLLERAFSLEDRFELSFWDSLIVAAAGQAACRYLLTEDLQDGQVLGGITVINPFLHPPNEFELGA
jgi:predicted nucleic acid-binding protein